MDQNPKNNAAPMITLQRTTSENPDFQALVALLDQDLRIRDGAEHAFFAQYNKLDNIKHVVVYYADGQAQGCGAFKEYEPDVMEIKRMFVLPDHRGKGIASQILQTLEAWVKELNYPTCILETGIRQPEAIALYEKAGYARIPNYGQYATVQSSVCMRKELGPR
jgi:putative acetyltransferase